MRRIAVCAFLLLSSAATAFACPAELTDEQLANLRQGLHEHNVLTDAPAPPAALDDTTLVFAIMTFASFALVFVPMLAGRHGLRRARRAISVERELAMRVAHLQRLRAMLAVIGALLVGVAISSLQVDPSVRMLMFVAPNVLMFSAVITVLRTHNVFAALLDEGTVASYDGGRYLFVVRDQQVVGWLVAWPSTLDRAAAHTMPRASLL